MTNFADQDLSGIKAAVRTILPAGAYSFIVSASHKEINSKPAISIKYTVIETVGSDLPEADWAEPGTEHDEVIFYKEDYAKYSLPKLDKLLQTAGKPFGDGARGNVSTIIENLQGLQIAAVIKQKKDKKPPHDLRSEVDMNSIIAG